MVRTNTTIPWYAQKLGCFATTLLSRALWMHNSFEIHLRTLTYWSHKSFLASLLINLFINKSFPAGGQNTWRNSSCFLIWIRRNRLRRRRGSVAWAHTTEFAWLDNISRDKDSVLVSSQAFRYLTHTRVVPRHHHALRIRLAVDDKL